jgi:hypothetical protein
MYSGPVQPPEHADNVGRSCPEAHNGSDLDADREGDVGAGCAMSAAACHRTAAHLSLGLVRWSLLLTSVGEG